MQHDDSSPPAGAAPKPYLVLDRAMPSPVEGAVRALFIGTSHTEYHSMPELAARLSTRPLFCEAICHPMRSLAEHAERERARAALDAQPWDALVLQERTLAPLEDWDAHARAVAWWREAAKGARVIVQRHWPRASWHGDYRDRRALVGDGPRAMFERLQRASERLVREQGVQIAPVGDAWMIAMERVAPQRLYYRGGNHGSLAGALLTAHVYGALLSGAATDPMRFRHEQCWDLSEPLFAWAQRALQGDQR